MITVYRLDPLADPRWEVLVEGHPRASVFHTTGWLAALRRTFGYRPIVYTTGAPGTELRNGLVVCEVRSRLTGKRLVSVPFSDHCAPLVDHRDDIEALLEAIEQDCAAGRYQYAEIRPPDPWMTNASRMVPSQTFVSHILYLHGDPDTIFRGLHKDCVQRKIRRAGREGLTYQEGRAAAHLAAFYELLLRTCRRRRLPPHPRTWFSNLVDCLGDKMKVRLVSKDGAPIASIITLALGNRLVYKYGCSDERSHHLGGMQLLFWHTIREAARNGVREFDLGRSDLDNQGLVTFKDRWGATRAELTYWRYPARAVSPLASGWRLRFAKTVFARIPASTLGFAGDLLYRHVG